MSAIKEYENNKWKVIGQKVGKPAKACEQYAKEHFPGRHLLGNALTKPPGAAQFPNMRPRSRQWRETDTSYLQISSTLRSVARSRRHQHQPWRRIARRPRRVLHPSARNRSRTRIHILLHPLYLSFQVRTASAHPEAYPRVPIPTLHTRSRTFSIRTPRRGTRTEGLSL